MESKIPPPLVALLLAVAMVSATCLVPAFPLARPRHFALADIFALVSSSFAAPAVFAFRPAGEHD